MELNLIPTKTEDLQPAPSIRSLLLWGGGTDSTTLAVWLRKQEVPLLAFHVDYGQKSIVGERAAISYFAEKYSIPTFFFDCRMGDLCYSAIVKGEEDNLKNDIALNVLEGRNVTLLALACQYAVGADISDVYVGLNAEPLDRPFPDATIEYWRSFQAMIDCSFRPRMEIHAPFAGISRLEILRLGRSMDPDIGRKTFSCFEGITEPCGHCDHCVKQKEMFTALGEVWP